MATILVIDDEAIVREPIAASLRAHGYNVACAGDGRAALACCRAAPPDLILLDVRMPDQDGLALLRDLRAATKITQVPVLLLTGAADRQVIVEAAKLGVQGYILKSGFSLKEFLARIAALLVPAAPVEQPAVKPAAEIRRAAEPAAKSAPRRAEKSIPADSPKAKPAVLPVSAWPRLLTREQTLERLDQVAGSKTLAGVVTRLISVANSAEANLSDVVQVIQSDPILAARVLQLANSASAGSRGRIRTVEDAARNVGVRGIQNMAISIGIVGAFPPDENDGFNTMRCWQHSYAVAELLNLLLREKNPEQESLNHLIGLCHDLGEILIRQHFAAEYTQILQFAMDHRLAPHKVEAVALGIRQPELISRLLARIGLPVPVVQAIREFCERQDREQASGISVGALGLSLANLAAHGLLFAASLHDAVRPVTRTEWRQLAIDKPPPAFDPALKRNEVLTATNILARLPANEEARLLIPPVPRHPHRIAYVRPEVFVEFDPLAFALSLCCDLVISRDMPAPGQWADFDGLVVLGLRKGVTPVIPAELSKAAAAAAKPQLPMLALIAQEGPPSAEGSLVVRSYPISLEEIGHWLAGIPVRDPGEKRNAGA